jgi:hypothetical protein
MTSIKQHLAFPAWAQPFVKGDGSMDYDAMTVFLEAEADIKRDRLVELRKTISTRAALGTIDRINALLERMVAKPDYIPTAKQLAAIVKMAAYTTECCRLDGIEVDGWKRIVDNMAAFYRATYPDAPALEWELPSEEEAEELDSLDRELLE